MPDLFRSNSADEASRATPPIFVVGSARSGTKMLRELLNNAPDIWIPQVESVFIPHFSGRISRYGDLSKWDNFQQLAGDIGSTRAALELADLGIHIEPRKWYDSCRSYEWPAVLEAYYRCVFEAEQGEGKRPWEEIIWGDKTPDYVSEIPLLSKLFPESRFIHIIRDPRDICLSAMKVWNKHPLRTVQLWDDEVNSGRRDGRALGPARYYELRYEDLLDDVRGELEGIFRFLGIPLPENAGELSRTPEYYGDAKGRQKVLKDNKGKWKSQLPPHHQSRIESIAGATLDELGYERLYSDAKPGRLNSLQMKLYRYLDIWHMTLFRRKERGSWREAFEFLLSR